MAFPVHDYASWKRNSHLKETQSEKCLPVKQAFHIFGYETLWSSHIRLCSVYLYTFKKGHPAFWPQSCQQLSSKQSDFACLLLWLYGLFCFVHLFSLWIAYQRNSPYCRSNFWHFLADKHASQCTYCTRTGYSTIRPDLFCLFSKTVL